MPTCEREIQSLDDLRVYVTQILCEYDQLEAGAFRMTERVLLRNSKPCGIFFCLHGPRSVKFSAIYETKFNTVLFYSSSGERFRTTRLPANPMLKLAA